MAVSSASRIETVLVVDDEDTWLRAVKRRLYDRRVVMAKDPDVACALARSEHPQLVLVDLRLGFANGLDVVRALRVDLPGVPMVLTSCFLDPALAAEAIHAGADDALEKIVDVRHIVESIEQGRRPVSPALHVPTAKQVEDSHILKIITACNGNKSEAARRLGMRRTTLQKRLQRPSHGCELLITSRTSP